MKPQAPGVSPVRDLTLPKINDQLTRIRQRLDGADRRSVENPATTDQIQALQDQINRITTAPTAVSQPTPGPVAASMRAFAFFAG